MADKLAGEGAERASLPYATLAEYDSTDELAWQVQRRLIAIVTAGTTKEQDRKDALAHRKKRRELAKQKALLEQAGPEEEPQVDLEFALGAREIPVRFGGSKSTDIHISHKMETNRGLFWCTKCGSFASTRGRGLLHQCLGFPTETGRVVLDRTRRGLTPHYSVKFDDE